MKQLSRPNQPVTSRRAFLKFLAGSPLLPLLGLSACSSSDEPRSSRRPGIESSGIEGLDAYVSDIIRRAEEAINVFDFEAVARTKLPPAHYGYLATGVGSNATLKANRDAFSELYLRPRRLVDVTKIDMSVELFGVKWNSPVILAPAGSQKAFHPQGEIAVAKAAKTKNHLQILSTVTTSSVENVIEARETPVWYQLYATAHWNITQALLQRAKAAGCPVVVLTVDIPTPPNRVTQQRFLKRDKRSCVQCHLNEPRDFINRKPMFDGLDVTKREEILSPQLTWDFVKRLKDETDMKLVIKGIVTGEDASRCLENGVDGIIVSNHGGRAEESGRATIACLSEVVHAVDGRIPVLIDGGFRRGTDVFKALALGANAICIGRPYLWGLAAFGQTGVEKVLDIVRTELEVAMKLNGTRSLQEIDRARIGMA